MDRYKSLKMAVPSTTKLIAIMRNQRKTVIFGVLGQPNFTLFSIDRWIWFLFAVCMVTDFASDYATNLPVLRLTIPEGSVHDTIFYAFICPDP